LFGGGFETEELNVVERNAETRGIKLKSLFRADQEEFVAAATEINQELNSIRFGAPAEDSQFPI
jgi:hypothetical protein